MILVQCILQKKDYCFKVNTAKNQYKGLISSQNQKFGLFGGRKS